MSEPADAPFPGDAAVADAYTATCSSAVSFDQAWWAFAPDAATRAAGDRFIDCWVGDDDDASLVAEGRSPSLR